MRFLFKTDYRQDIRLFKHRGDGFWYSLLGALVLLAPLGLGTFYVGELTYVFILAIAGTGLMLLTGFTGQVSLGHGAFVGIGAYAHGFLLTQSVPFWLSVPSAALITAAIGLVVAIPALRTTGIYLAMATLAFGLLAEHVFVHWEAVTGGLSGFAVPRPTLAGIEYTRGVPFYYLCLAVLTAVILLAMNLLRSTTGRAFIAIRDSEIAAQSMGVSLAFYKSVAFAVSAAITGLAGALFAHQMGFLAAETFNVLLSIQLLLMVVVGGLGSLHGAVYGALFVGALPQAIALLRDVLPQAISRQPSLEPGLFGLILVAFILFEPTGIYGRWAKVRHLLRFYPIYKKATFKRQKAFLRTERLR